MDRKLIIISNWLLTCCAAVIAMIVIGAITRLSGSGLSMVEWRPLMGTLPPMNEAEWARVFDLYKQSPEFVKKNFWMDLSDFKSIFFWEWFHRFLGRLIGIIYALPFIFFLVRGWIPRGYKLKLLGLFLLGGAQGFMGWYMVKSGLSDTAEVSHYRLAAHLSLALLIHSLMYWLALTFRKTAHQTPPDGDSSLYSFGWLVLGCLILTIFWGAYTAGLDAGLAYGDTFPKMGNHWIPKEIWFYKPVWVNFFELDEGVQFVHRWLAIITCFTILTFVGYAGYKKRVELCFPILGIMVLMQVGLGIATLFTKVHLHVAVTHQLGAVILLTLLLSCLHAVKFKPLSKPY